MLKRFLTVCFAALIVFSCNDEDESKRGTLLVTVLFNDNPVPEGVKVVTYPFTEEVETDEFGQAQFEKLPYKQYEVYAYVPNFGSGKKLVNVDAELSEAEVDLIQGVLIQPAVNIISPVNGTGFAFGENVALTAEVDDNSTPVEDLQLMWESSRDGELGEGEVTEDGVATLSIDDLTKGIHVIRLLATNNLGIVSKDSVTINTLSPKSPVLSGSIVSGKVSLQWVAEAATDFSKFEVYRSTTLSPSPVLVSSIASESTKTYSEGIAFADSVYYVVRAVNQQGYYSQSNQVALKGNTTFDFQIMQAEMSPNSNLIFTRTSDHDIIVFDYVEREIVWQESFDSEIGYFSIGSNGFGEELYVPRSNGWVSIYNANTFAKKTEFSVGAAATCVISDNNGVLYVSRSPSPWWEQPLRSYRRNDLSLIGGTGDFDRCRLRLLPSGNEIIEITTSVGPTDMDYYSFSSGVPSTHSNDWYHGDHPLSPNIFKVAPALGYLVTATTGAIYSANSSMTYFASLPGAGFDFFSDFEFSQDGSRIYASVGTQNSIKTYSYPSLAQTPEIKTVGYPAFIFRKGAQIITVSSAFPLNAYFDYYGVDNFGFEIVNIP